MNFVLGYLVFLGMTLNGVVVNKKMEPLMIELRQGTQAPVVVPKEAGIYWLTEKTTKARKEWDLSHPQ